MDKYFEPINKLYLSQPFTERGDEGELDRCLHIAEAYALAEKKRTNKWLAEQLGKDPATVSK